MPDENEKTKKTSSGNLSPEEIDDNAASAESANSKKGFLSSMFNIFKHLFPALKEAFATGAKAFQSRVQGVPPQKQDDEEDEGEILKDDRPKLDETDGEDGEESPPPPPKAGFFKSKLAAFSKKRKIILAFSIVLIITISICGGLYLGGMFDKDKDAAASDKAVAAAPQENSRQVSFFDSIFGKKNQPPAKPQDQLKAMHISYTPTNFVKYAGQNDIPIVKLFIQAGMHPDTRRSLDGFTPLMAAASFGRLEMAEFLLSEKEVDINATDKAGQTSLMKAVRHNRPEMAELLLAKNADYNIADKQGNTALRMVMEYPKDSPLAQIFAKFDIDITTPPKETAKEPAIKEELPLPTQLETPPTESTPSTQPKQSRTPEISVEDFLKFIKATDNQ